MLRKDAMHRLTSALSSYTLLTILYLLLVIVLPANKAAMQAYHLSALEYHVLLFVVVLPLIAIWFAAFYGYAKLRQYADSISKTAEGANFDRLASGFMWLAWGLPVPSIISLILNSITNAHPGFRATGIIITNYIDLAIPLVAFSLISNGSRGLLDYARVRISTASAKLIILVFVVLGVLYCFLTFRHLDPHSAGSTNNPFYLPAWLMVLTIIVPYLYAWFIGLLGANEIMLFAKQSQGVLYRKSLRILAIGIIAVIASSIAVQYVSTVEPRLGHLSLNYLLAITYLIRIVAAMGYVLIAIGAIRLKKIEDV